MTQITVNADCSNSSKNEFLRDFNLLIVNQEIEKALDYVTDDIKWNMIGNFDITGKDAFRKECEQGLNDEMQEFVIENILTHGKLGAGNGYMIMSDGTKYEYCDIYEFESIGENKKIRSMKSYVIKVEE
ncbi:nuclear transport factor 2 family protein [Candidatus Dojkabacteria bacterium]|uniref:Nuclear transport factor 2 family protein n=1 Tax=Candidatus Dojkabacteria bacterium TaxID=2099670 RepID=A0A955LB09_9BACT|nr:nuclear transport factor 2 family protein [Candidatus Dojkabacteria bacterium]